MPFQWGFDQATERWVLLEPFETDDDLEKSYVDENGNHRADHRDRCRGKSVNVTRLETKIPPQIGPGSEESNVEDLVQTEYSTKRYPWQRRRPAAT